MGTTPINNLPYPEATDQPFVHLDLKELAEAVAAILYITCTSTTRPAHRAGRRIFETDTLMSYVSNGSAWYTDLAGSKAIVQSIGTGGGNLATTVTTPANGASVTLPAGTWLVTYYMNYALSVASAVIPATIGTYLSESGAGNNLVSRQPVESTGTTSRRVSDFELITRTAESTFYLRGDTSATGGTQSFGTNKIVAVRVS